MTALPHGFCSNQQLYPFGYDASFDLPPPNPALRYDIQKFLRQIDKQLSDMDNHPPSTSSLTVKERIELLTHSSEYHHAVISPIRWLPEEILLKIIEHTRDPHHDIDFFSPFDIRNGPWVLTYVCRRWRLIAVSCPSLWSRIAVCSPPRMDQGPLPWGSAHLLTLCLERSQALPLALLLKLRELDWVVPHHLQPEELLQMLFAHAKRFEHMDVDVHPSLGKPFDQEEAPAQSGSATISFPRLKTLNVFQARAMPQWLIDAAFQRAPELQDLSASGMELCRLAIRMLPQLINVFNRLTSACLSRLSPNFALFALTEMHRLEDRLLVYLSFDLTDNDRVCLPRDFAPKSVRLPDLKAIQIDSLVMPVADAFLFYLDLPSLQQLEMRTCDNADCIKQLVQRSNCSLTRLSMRLHKNDVASTISLLYHLPALESLELRIYHFCPQTLLDVLIAPSEGKQPLCSKLVDITFVGMSSMRECDISALERLVRSRSHPLTSPLQSINFTFYGDQPKKKFLKAPPNFTRILLRSLWDACRASQQTITLFVGAKCREGIVPYSFEGEKWDL